MKACGVLVVKGTSDDRQYYESESERERVCDINEQEKEIGNLCVCVCGLSIDGIKHGRRAYHRVPLEHWSSQQL